MKIAAKAAHKCAGRCAHGFLPVGARQLAFGAPLNNFLGGHVEALTRNDEVTVRVDQHEPATVVYRASTPAALCCP
jgi:hypothetical protein